MKFLIQRTVSGKVAVEGKTVGEIGQGYVVFIGITDTDTAQTADKMVRKMLNLRIFEDTEGKTNRSLADVGGGLLLISQFTLYADCKKGNRPSFVKAGNPEHANALYEYIIELCKKECPVVQHGVFGAEMKVDLINDGPFTILLDSDEIFRN